MSEKQMFEALNQFLHFVSDDTWTKWQKNINGEIYGDKNEKRYLFLRDSFAKGAVDDEAEFAKLAHLTGPEFDAAVDSAMAHDKEIA